MNWRGNSCLLSAHHTRNPPALAWCVIYLCIYYFYLETAAFQAPITAGGHSRGASFIYFIFIFIFRNSCPLTAHHLRTYLSVRVCILFSSKVWEYFDLTFVSIFGAAVCLNLGVCLGVCVLVTIFVCVWRFFLIFFSCPQLRWSSVLPTNSTRP